LQHSENNFGTGHYNPTTVYNSLQDNENLSVGLCLDPDTHQVLNENSLIFCFLWW